MSRSLAKAVATRSPSPAPERSLGEIAYAKIKASLYEFELLPGDHFTESAIAERLEMSRTPVRDALYRLEREGFLEVHLRVGWRVRPYDFEKFENLYDLRLILEQASVTRLCDLDTRPGLDLLKEQWLVPVAERKSAMREVAALDEAFHTTLVEAAGNPEVARCHHEVTERIRVIRRLDFSQSYRIDKTYEEHGQILRAVIRRRADEANRLLRSHIEASKAEVRKITLHRLYTARSG